MYEILNNWLYLFTGMLGGLILGWSLRTMQDVRHMKNMTSSIEHKLDLLRPRVPQQRKHKDHARNERGWYTHRISLFVVVSMTAVAAVWTGIVNNKLQTSQNCTEATFSKVITTLTERTSATTDVNIADSAQSVAFATLISRLLDTKNPPDETTRRVLTQDYLSKLITYNEAKAVRDKSGKFPTKEEYKKCLEGG